MIALRIARNFNLLPVTPRDKWHKQHERDGNQASHEERPF
jgi:hypothetical protein